MPTHPALILNRNIICPSNGAHGMPLVSICIIPEDTLLAPHAGDCQVHFPLLLGRLTAPSVLGVRELLASFVFVLRSAVG